MKRITLNKEHLTKLIKGEVLIFESFNGNNQSKVEITLSDIGFSEIKKALFTVTINQIIEHDNNLKKV